MKNARPNVRSIVASLCVALNLLAGPAVAADFVVSDCGDDGGETQLRARIDDANNTAIGGNITFSCGPATIVLASALPNILTEITIDGGGNITLSGNDTVPIFNSFGSLRLSNLAIVDGKATGNAGAIYSANSELTLENVTVESSRAQNDGGALYISGSTVRIEDSTFSGNEAGADGGAIYNFKGTVTLENVDVAGSKAGAYAGALFNDGGQVSWTGGSVTDNDANDAGAIATADRGQMPGAKTDVSFVRVSGNAAVNRAGAFYVFPSASLEVSDSAITGNEAGGDGGALYNQGGSVLERVLLRSNSTAGSGGGISSVGGSTSIVSSTLHANAGLIGASIANGEGELVVTNATIVGGASMTASVLQYGTGSTLLTNTILEAGASPVNCEVPEEEPGTIGSGNHNMSDDQSCQMFLTELADLSMADAMLGPLKNNGGVTDTMVPQAGSVAVDATAEGCPADDQRGVPRPQGVQCDIGAAEVVACGDSVPDLCGDANGDDSVTAPDALQALRTSVGTATCEIWLCDYNGSGGITAADALAILRKSVGQQLTPACPVPYDCFDYL